MTIIQSRRVYTDEGLKPAGISVRNGIIQEILPYQELKNGSENGISDFENDVIIPGLIDPHIHINEPGRADWEGFESATKAAAAGGITLLADMPLNSSPVTTSAEALQLKTESSANKLNVDCTFYGGAIPGNEAEIAKLAEAGVPGIKVFLCDSGLDEFPAVGEMELQTIMPVLAGFGLPLLVHAELTDDTISPNSDFTLYQNYADTRPDHFEINAIEMMIRLCRETGCRVHIVHVATAKGAKLIKEAKREGLPLTCETAPHYLYFTSETIQNGKTTFKCAPPLRDQKNRDGLIQGLLDGTIDFIGTDHSPCPPELKSMDSGNFYTAWGGISSLQLLLPALWTSVKDHGADVTDIVKWTSSEPAKFLGLDHKTGFIREGYEANLTVWDPDSEFTVKASDLYHKHKITPYDGEKLAGIVKSVFLRGQQVFDGSEFKHNTGKTIFKTERMLNE